jgi:hypothetical protein
MPGALQDVGGFPSSAESAKYGMLGAIGDPVDSAERGALVWHVKPSR